MTDQISDDDLKRLHCYRDFIILVGARVTGNDSEIPRVVYDIVSSTVARLEAAEVERDELRVRVSGVRDLIDFYFEDWGAKKGSLWESISGGMEFSSENMLRAIELHLETNGVAKNLRELTRLRDLEIERLVLQRADAALVDMAEMWDGVADMLAKNGKPTSHAITRALAIREAAGIVRELPLEEGNDG